MWGHPKGWPFLRWSDGSPRLHVLAWAALWELNILRQVVDGERILARLNERDLHHQRHRDIGTCNAPRICHAAGLERRFEAKSIDHLPGFETTHVHHRPQARRAARNSGRPASRILRAAVSMSYGTR